MRRRLAELLLLSTLPACLPPEAELITNLALDVEASHITGPLTLNGGPFPNSQNEKGTFVLRGQGDDAVPLGQTLDHSYDAFVVNSVYDFNYQLGAGGAVVPANELAEVISDRGIPGDAAIPIDVDAVAISATFTLNGGAFPLSQYDGARFYLQPVGTEALIYLGDSHLANPPVMVVPGTYHVIYDHRQGTTSPINKRTRVRENVVLTANQQLPINVVASSLRLTFTLNGNPFPASQYDDANFFLRDEVTGAESRLMNSHAPVASVIAIDGTYDVIYRHETGDEVPLNTAAVLVNDFVLSAGGALKHDIIAASIDATVTLNNSPFPVSEYDDGIILLHDPRTNTVTELGNTHSPFTGLMLIPGTYDVLYSHETGDAVPQNVRGTVAKDVVIGNADLIVNVQGVQIGADVSLNGDAFPASEYDDANFFLTGAQSAEAILVGNSHDQDLSVMVLPGTYDLMYRHETGDAVPRNNNYRVLAQQVLASTTTLEANLETRLVRVSATLNNEPFPAGPFSKASIYARTHAEDDVLMLETEGAPQTVRLIAGTYDFYYAHTVGFNVPRNPWAYVGEAVLD